MLKSLHLHLDSKSCSNADSPHICSKCTKDKGRRQTQWDDVTTGRFQVSRRQDFANEQNEVTQKIKSLFTDDLCCSHHSVSVSDTGVLFSLHELLPHNTTPLRRHWRLESWFKHTQKNKLCTLISQKGIPPPPPHTPKSLQWLFNGFQTWSVRMF